MLPTWRGQNEQSMALAAIAFAKARRRRQIMVATSSIGPGATNMVTAAGVAHANRLPVLLLSGDNFVNRAARPGAAAGRAFRRPDGQRQRCLQGGDALLGSHHPAGADHLSRCRRRSRRCSTRPTAVRRSSACARTCRPRRTTTRRASSSRVVHRIPRPRPDARAARGRGRAAADRQEAADHRRRRRALRGADEALAAFAERHRVPVGETIAGRTVLLHEHPMNVGPIGVIGLVERQRRSRPRPTWCWRSARGCRISRPAPGRCSRTTCGSSASTPRASTPGKHRALPVVGDALVALEELSEALGDWAAPDELAAARAPALRRVERVHRPAQRPDQRRAADLRPGGGRGEPRCATRATWR